MDGIIEVTMDIEVEVSVEVEVGADSPFVHHTDGEE